MRTCAIIHPLHLELETAPCMVWIDEAQSDCFKKRIEAEEEETGWLSEEDMVSGKNER
jgi:hypothetical protein